MNRFTEYGQAVQYNNRKCYITGKRAFWDTLNNQKIIMYHIIAKHFDMWVNAQEVRLKHV